MWCAQKFIPSHNYLRSQLYQLLVEEPADDDPRGEGSLECVDLIEEVNQKHNNSVDVELVILFHALWGTNGC